jgi:hypothetical protein
MGGAGGAPSVPPPPACEEPVACAGTMMGSWCADTLAPPDPMTSQLNAVWSSGPSDVWVVGEHGGTNGFAFHWDGCAWTAASISTTAGLKDVWGSGPSDVWIVGTQATTLHWNGSSWSSVPNGATGDFDNLSGSSSGDVWAIGNAGLYHWNGSAWALDARLAVNSVNGFLGDIWAVAPDDVWVAEGFNVRGSVAHFDGAAWTVTLESPFVDFGLFGIWSDGTTTWAVGEGEQADRETGGVWTHLQGPGGSSEGWTNVMGSGTDVYAVGLSIALSTGGGMFQDVADAPQGFYRGVWVTTSQVWAAGGFTGGPIVVHRAR